MIVFIVEKEKIWLYWEHVSGYIQDSLKYSDDAYNLDSIKDSLIKGIMQLWVILDDKDVCAAVVTQAVSYPNQKVIEILFIGGSGMSSWLHLINDIKLWSKNLGYDAVQIYGRPGWEKLLDKYGFYKTHVLLRTKLLN